MSNPMSTPRAASYAMLVLAPALLLAACGGNGDSATSSQSSPASQAASDRPVTDSVHVDAAIEKNPCELAPAEMVAGLFGVPAADLERESSMSSACVYSWENDDETERLDVKVKVSDVDESADGAASNFRSVTRGMSGADVDRAMAGVKEKAASEGKLDTAGKDQLEAQMILNHKAAIEMLVEQAGEIGFNRYTVQNLHALLADNLLPAAAAGGRLRRVDVAIAGSVYQPLAVPQQIEEHFDTLLAKAQAIEDTFEQAFFAMVQLPYLQPFDDINKRTSRLAANIPLIRHNLAPLSFVDVPHDLYIEGTLGGYEINRKIGRAQV